VFEFLLLNVLKLIQSVVSAFVGRAGNNITDIVPVSASFRYSQPHTLLHGTLEVYIDKAVRLPNMDVFSQKISDFASGLAVFQKSKSKSKLNSPNVRITSDPYVTVVLQDARVARTRVISNSVNPEWREHFSVPVAHYVTYMVFTVKDQDVLGTQHIGDVKIPVEKVLNGGVVEGWFDVLDSQGKQTKHQAQLCLTARYIPVEQNMIYTQGIPGADSHAVPSTYFPSRKGCRLTLYQIFVLMVARYMSPGDVGRT
jgi:phospholipase D1/2